MSLLSAHPRPGPGTGHSLEMSLLPGHPRPGPGTGHSLEMSGTLNLILKYVTKGKDPRSAKYHQYFHTTDRREVIFPL